MTPTPEQIAADLATMLAKRRTNGAVYMGGEHNPHPGEIRAARDFVRDFVQARIDRLRVDLLRVRGEREAFRRRAHAAEAALGQAFLYRIAETHGYVADWDTWMQRVAALRQAMPSVPDDIDALRARGLMVTEPRNPDPLNTADAFPTPSIWPWHAV